jgi:hypothetical protein
MDPNGAEILILARFSSAVLKAGYGHALVSDCSDFHSDLGVEIPG